MINAAMAAYKRRHCPADRANFEPLLRTSHPSYWTSRYVITNYSADRATVTFRLTRTLRRATPT